MRWDIGPLRTLGNPADVFPEPGAERTYVHDETWRHEVIRLVERAHAIIASAGVSEGISWELSWIRAAGHHRKLFLVFPPDSTVLPWRSFVLRYCEWMASRVFRMSGRPSIPAVPWSCIVQHMQSLGYQLDDHPPPPGSVIGFDPSVRAIRVATRAVTADDYSTAIAHHLHSLAM